MSGRKEGILYAVYDTVSDGEEKGRPRDGRAIEHGHLRGPIEPRRARHLPVQSLAHVHDLGPAGGHAGPVERFVGHFFIINNYHTF